MRRAHTEALILPVLWRTHEQQPRWGPSLRAGQPLQPQLQHAQKCEKDSLVHKNSLDSRELPRLL